jgi:hypothetical protein
MNLWDKIGSEKIPQNRIQNVFKVFKFTNRYSPQEN